MTESPAVRTVVAVRGTARLLHASLLLLVQMFLIAEGGSRIGWNLAGQRRPSQDGANGR